MAYTTTSYMPLKMPTPGTREPANISLLNENAVVLSGHDHSNGKGLPVTVLRSGLQANRPAAGNAGAVYLATDTGQFYVDTGTAWASFLTTAGAQTVTGWTLIDPIIRDTLLFGPEPTGTADTSITRSGANALQFSGNVGVGVAPPTAHPAYSPAIYVGSSAGLRSHTTIPQATLTNNFYTDASDVNHAVMAGVSSIIQLDQLGRLTFGNAPAVAAGATPTFTTRLTVDQAGNVGIGATPSPFGHLGLQVGFGMNVFGNSISSGSAGGFVANNLYYSAGWKSQGGSSGAGAYLYLNANGSLQYAVVASGAGAAGTAVTPIDKLSIGANGTVTLTPDAGQLGLVHGGHAVPQSDLQSNLGSGTNRYSTLYVTSISAGAGANLFLFGPAGYTLPTNDNANSLGHPSFRWGQIYSTVTTISTSHVSLKENFATLDGAACVEAVLTTDWLSFDYKVTAPDPGPPPPLPVPPDETPEATAEREAQDALNLRLYEDGKAGAAVARQQKGYVLGSDEYATADLFGQSDRYSASTHADLAVVACALQDALRRLAVLEGTDAAPA